jgi:hypothetical protein
VLTSKGERGQVGLWPREWSSAADVAGGTAPLPMNWLRRMFGCGSHRPKYRFAGALWRRAGGREIKEMSLEIDGFPSNDLAHLIARNRNENAQWFGLIERLNRVAQRLMLESIVPVHDNQAMLVLLLFTRALFTFQGAAFLIARGMTVDARTLARSCLELFCAVAKLTAKISPPGSRSGGQCLLGIT